MRLCITAGRNPCVSRHFSGAGWTENVSGQPYGRDMLMTVSVDVEAGVADSVMLRSIDQKPWGPGSTTLLEQIDPARLPAADMPTYIRLCDRAESAFAARRDEATLLMAGPSDRGKNYREVETPAHELSAALRIPLGAAHGGSRHPPLR